MIVVEGADNVGKSTLVEQLLALDPTLELLKRERFKPERGETIGSSYLKLLTHAKSNVVVDRLLASECIYGKLFRGGCRMTREEHFLIRAALRQHCALIVWCDVPDAQVLKSWGAREQLYQDPLKIARAYRLRIRQIFAPLEVVWYDWTKAGAEHARVRLIEHHNRTTTSTYFDLYDAAMRCED